MSARDILISRNIDEADIHTEIEKLKKNLEIIKSEKYIQTSKVSSKSTIASQ